MSIIKLFMILCRVNNHNSYHDNTINNIHNNIVDRDVDQLHKISNKSHDEETDCYCQGNLLKLYSKKYTEW